MSLDLEVYADRFEQEALYRAEVQESVQGTLLELPDPPVNTVNTVPEWPARTALEWDNELPF